MAGMQVLSLKADLETTYRGGMRILTRLTGSLCISVSSAEVVVQTNVTCLF